ncbi:serine hydrolase domain-containing protein [Kitasatospora phosalacinea]|uniref:serine hydrolase domain-containing protein n=1 Tax=Kitasatospora phosalacinea TaxID=2065 RepID=UPI0006898897|nr:serine hydrolase domain-containing protein [Kitasatospora phosalacinea]
MKQYRTGALRLAAALLAGASVFVPAASAGAAAAEPPTGAPEGPGSRPGAEARPGLLQQGLDALTGRAGASGAIGELRQDGRVVWRGTSGVGDLATGRPAPVEGGFRAGSVTKPFLATVVLQLVGEGRVGLDQPIERYLPGVVPNGAAITVRQVMNHTAGLFDYTEDSRFAYDTEADLRRLLDRDRWRTWSASELIGIGVSHPPYFAPGRGWHYSNTDYLLLGELVDRVTGHDWRSEVRHRVIQPLGLRRTSLPGTSTTVPGPHSHGYLALSDGPADVTDLNPSVAGAAGELVSSLDDLARFDAALLGGRLLAPAQLAQMTTTVPADAEPPTSYGLGLMELKLSCGSVWGHPGGIYGYSTYLFGDRAGRRQLAVSVNPYDPVKGAQLTPTAISLVDLAFCGPTGAS